MQKVGKIATIMRHPVKAITGESLDRVEIGTTGLIGDRTAAVIDESDKRKGKFMTPDIVPAILGYSAKLVGEEEGKYPVIEITSPSGTVYSWCEEALLAELSKLTERPLSTKTQRLDEPTINWEEHILVITDASLREIAAMCGMESIDHRRFRGNLVIALEENQPFVEETWTGKRLQIGDVVLEMVKMCERCMYVNIEPENQQMTPIVLKKIVKERNGCFGVYAKVVQTGVVKTGEDVFIL